MNLLDEELKQDAVNDAQEIAYLRKHLSELISNKLTNDDFQVLLDDIVEYFALSGILEQNGDIQIDAQEIATKIYEKLPLHEKLSEEEFLEILMADLDYNDI